MKEAARACSTFKYHNPLNQQILKDLAVYKNTKGVGPEDMQPISTIPYVSEERLQSLPGSPNNGRGEEGVVAAVCANASFAGF